MKFISGNLAAAVLLGISTGTQAGDLFSLIGATTDGGVPFSFSEGSSKLPTLVEELINGSGRFDPLGDRSFAASLNYGGVADALSFDIRQVGATWTAQLSSPFKPGLIDRSFSAASRSELDDEIEAYLKQEGSTDLARFLRAVGARSAAGVTDGNPAAATARSATTTYMEYAMRPTETAAEKVEGASTSRAGFAMTADAGSFRSQGIEGQSYSWTPMIPLAIGSSRRVRLELSLPLNYTSIEGAAQYRVGSQLGVAVVAVQRTAEQPWLWQVTPHVGAVVAGSMDMVAGGLLASGGGTSFLSYRLGAWEFSMGNHLSFHEGLRVSAGDYTFDPGVSQQIVKNGLKVGRSLGQNFYAEAYVLDTEFVQEAFTPRYLTIGAGVGYRGPKQKGYVMLGGYADIGSEFEAAHLQFGTGWKF